MKLVEKEGYEGGRWANNALPRANTKAPEHRAEQWEVGWGLTEEQPTLQLLHLSKEKTKTKS